jgi:hypothetical protein
MLLHYVGVVDTLGRLGTHLNTNVYITITGLWENIFLESFVFCPKREIEDKFTHKFHFPNV